MEQKIRIKVCGMRDESNIRQLCELPIHFIGFIFYPRSPRYAGEMPVDAARQVPEHIKKVGVFVGASVDEIRRITDRYRFDMVQLHGSESPEFCHILKQEGLVVVKSFAAVDQQLVECAMYQHACDYLLFDTPTIQHGGSGKKFDWSLLQNRQLPLPFFLSGGIGPDDAAQIKQFYHPQLFAVDVNSRFEIQPGLKDIDLLKRFIEQL